MKSLFLRFIKSKKFTDVNKVNSFLVTVFFKINKLTVKNNRILLKYFLPDDKHTCEFLNLCQKKKCTFPIELLTQLFEYVISPADRIVSGAVYTPQMIRKKIITDLFSDKASSGLNLDTLRIADISCGCGGFLLDACLHIYEKTGNSFSDIFKNNIFGIDVQSYAIERTKILLSLVALLHGEDSDFLFNLLCADSLDYTNNDWPTAFTKFDMIVGNPPYVCSRNLSSATLSKLSKFDVCSSGHPDLYIPFFKIGVDLLNDFGCLGYITMNSFFRSVNGRSIREYFSQKRFSIRILDFRGHQIFKSKNTYTCLFYLNKNRHSDFIEYALCEPEYLQVHCKFSNIYYDSLDVQKGWSLNNPILTRSFESSGKRISDYCQSRHGIATLSNAVYIFKPESEDENYFYLKRNEDLYPIEKTICRDIVNPNKLNSINNLDLISEKVIFPYSISSDQAIVFSPELMKTHYPKAFLYLKANKDVLLQRDKGNVDKYPQWYAFGRTQSLIMPRYKLFFPKLANKPVRCLLSESSDLIFYNGLAFVSSDKRKLRILKRILESALFWGYIQNNAKPYSSGYFSLTGVDIKNFCIPNFTIDEENKLLSIKGIVECEKWLERFYHTV